MGYRRKPRFYGAWNIVFLALAGSIVWSVSVFKIADLSSLIPII